MWKRSPKSIVLITCGLLLGLALASAVPEAKGRVTVADIGLGDPAAKVVSQMGNPVKISYTADVQIWYYTTKEGETSGRYWLNDGLVVRIAEN